MRFPTIASVAVSLRELSFELREDRRVFLRVDEDGSWSLQPEGEAPRVKGRHVSSVVIPGGNGKKRRFPSTEFARDLVKEVRDAHTAHVRAEKEAKVAKSTALKEQRERKRRITATKNAPYAVGTRVVYGAVKGVVVGHGVVHGQLGPTHVHLIQVDDPQMVQPWNVYVSILTVADSLVKLDLDVAQNLAVH